MLKELCKPWDACDKFLSDSTKHFSTTAPNTCFDKEREAESHGHPIGAFQILSKTAEILSASVALPLQEIVVVT